MKLVFLSILIGSIILCGGFPLLAQEADIRSKQKELERLRREIGKYESKIKEQEEKEHTTLELLDSYDKQSTLLRKLIARLRDEELKLQNNINETQRSIERLNSQISHLKLQYAQHVKALYQNGRSYDLELLFTSKSMNQLLIRSEYLKRFSDQRKVDVEKIEEKIGNTRDQKLLLQRQLTEQRELITEKRKEEEKLTAKTEKRKKLLTEIRRDKKLLRQEVSRAATAAKELEQLIAILIEEERKKKEREAALAKESKRAHEMLPTIPGLSFEEKRGRLRWPVTHGKVVAGFGNQQHPILKTITQNTGIDISVPPGTDVAAVASGEVSKISWLPSFGNLVILDHSRGYRTVYAHLSEIYVTEGQKVEENDLIGKSGESISGQILHFEIWKDRQKQDPEAWLIPQGLTRR